MEFFCYHRDRQGSMDLRRGMLERHWGYMDHFADRMVARGPTFAGDGILTGSVHIVDLPDVTAARAFAFDEPGYQAGVYREVMLLSDDARMTLGTAVLLEAPDAAGAVHALGSGRHSAVEVHRWRFGGRPS